MTVGAAVRGLYGDQPVTIEGVRWYSPNAVEVVFKDAQGGVHTELAYRTRESELAIEQSGQGFDFGADGALFRLASEAQRILLAHLFDPLLAIHTSMVEPLPHQILAVYESMLTRQPLRFLLADDPGAGKTIMAGLFIRELMVRGDLKRCLIVCPSMLTEQWQEELASKFHVPFAIVSRQAAAESQSGNPFLEHPLAISRLDYMARSGDVMEAARQVDWDLIVVDEAHRMSASFFGGEVRRTKRYQLGQTLGAATRHFLLMSATPHNGKEEDFQLFMALLDADRFEGRFRDGVQLADTSDLMRRMVKEQLLTFDGTPLFPERIAYTVTYDLSPAEQELYAAVTAYVREEWNRADALEEDGRRGTIGFALTILQRRLASSPEAIYQSLTRRMARLESRLREESIAREQSRLTFSWRQLSDEDIDELDEFPEDEETDEEIVDQSTAAKTIAELAAEIETLRGLVRLAKSVRQSGQDRKWEELSAILCGDDGREGALEVFDAQGFRRKLVIFTEHRDTLTYLADRIQTLLGRQEAVATIHGGMGREERRIAQERFTQDRDVLVLVATDAAGEGINLQRAHLMVNYDLPWNPNRLEQRFGRIHRIGQTEVCHLWNLVAGGTREGDVFVRLLVKLQAARVALGGAVYDVLGRMFEGRKLRELLIEAVRYGERSDVRARMDVAVDVALSRERLRSLLEERALTHDSMDLSRVLAVKEQMERAAARRLQPHFVAAFFRAGLARLGGILHEREGNRYEVTHVPAAIRDRDRVIGTGAPVLPKYERICFDKSLVRVSGQPLAEFVCPGHPLLDAVVDLTLERYRGQLLQGAVLVDDRDEGTALRLLVYLRHEITDQRVDAQGRRRVVAQQLHFVEMTQDGGVRDAGYAPYLDYRALTEDEAAVAGGARVREALTGVSVEGAMAFAVEHIVPAHLDEWRIRRNEWAAKTLAAVRERLVREIAYLDHRAEELSAAERAGKINARLNADNFRRRADDLQERLRRRERELDAERLLSAAPPVVIGAAAVLPAGLLRQWMGADDSDGAECAGAGHAANAALVAVDAEARRRVEQLAMAAVMESERRLGYEPRDVSAQKVGYDIESRVPGTGRLRFVEVKGRRSGAETVTLTRNEILTARNKPEDYWLAVVEVTSDQVGEPVYVRPPFQNELDFGVTSVTYDLQALFAGNEARLA